VEVESVDERFDRADELRSEGELLAAVDVYEAIERDAAEDCDGEPAEDAAQALIDKASVLLELDRVDEAFAAYDGVSVRYGDSDEPELVEQVAWALAWKAVAMQTHGRLEEAVALSDAVVTRYAAGDTDLRLITTWPDLRRDRRRRARRRRAVRRVRPAMPRTCSSGCAANGRPTSSSRARSSASRTTPTRASARSSRTRSSCRRGRSPGGLAWPMPCRSLFDRFWDDPDEELSHQAARAAMNCGAALCRPGEGGALLDLLATMSERLEASDDEYLENVGGGARNLRNALRPILRVTGTRTRSLTAFSIAMSSLRRLRAA
jgi:hypothetical protein